MKQTLTLEEVDKAEELHNSGVSWSIVAAYLHTTEVILREHRKKFDKEVRTYHSHSSG